MEVGWAGSAPHFIYMHHTSLTAPAHLFFVFAFVVRDDLARLLCDSFADMRSGNGRSAAHGHHPCR